jgi:hypothetical protein
MNSAFGRRIGTRGSTLFSVEPAVVSWPSRRLILGLRAHKFKALLAKFPNTTL